MKKTNISILVIDDSATSRMVVSKQLSKMGYENVMTAVDGDDALDKLNTKRPDVIFLDLVMPKKSGLEVMEDIRKKYGEKNYPYVIAMTANELTTDKTKCIKAGMNDFITKPVTMDNLNKVLQNI